MKNWQQSIEKLLDWFRRNHRPFPWREDPNPYWVWLAEIMSQQTQMAALLPYFHRFIKKFPNLEVLASAEEESVLAAWAGLGYYSRARNVHRTAKQVTQSGGRWPQTLAGLLDLPGVGPYTAAAIASQCFSVKEPVWDGNVVRVCSRLFMRADAHGLGFRGEMMQILRGWMSAHEASLFNQSIMELGALVCTPRNPRCGECPLQEICGAYAAGSAAEYPPPKPRKAAIELKPKVWIELRETEQGFEAWLEPRESSRWFSGLWDFSSELGGVAKPVIPLKVEVKEYRPLGKAKHSITHHKIELEGWIKTGKAFEKKQGQGRWLQLEALTTDQPPVPLATTAKKMLRLIGRAGIR